jgi:hypothetical protein
MGDIYSAAVKVITWLGDETTESSLAFEFLNFVDMKKSIGSFGQPEYEGRMVHHNEA